MQNFTCSVDLPDSMAMDRRRFRKMLFLSNAVEDGWSVRKRDRSYIFSKKHKGRREVFADAYLDDFVRAYSGSDGGLPEMRA